MAHYCFKLTTVEALPPTMNKKSHLCLLCSYLYMITTEEEKTLNLNCKLNILNAVIRSNIKCKITVKEEKNIFV